jgi:release factor glutamine methyltransferase
MIRINGKTIVTRDFMTLSEALRKGKDILKASGNEAPAGEVGVMLCSAAGCDRLFLYTHGDMRLDDYQEQRFMSMLQKRALGVPLQYITGMQEFMSLPFKVREGVLVPRQETELLVETVISCLGGKVELKATPNDNANGSIVSGLSILDIGTGSGCIAVSLAYYLPQAVLTAVDKMADALEIARENADMNGVAGRISFIQSDLFECLDGLKYDAIVSNPPYIRTDDIPGLQREVRCYEPLAALDGGSDGLYFYRAIIKDARLHLNENGLIAFETGYDQAAVVAGIMSDDFRDIEIKKDLSGIDRVVTGRLK